MDSADAARNGIRSEGKVVTVRKPLTIVSLRPLDMNWALSQEECHFPESRLIRRTPGHVKELPQRPQLATKTLWSELYFGGLYDYLRVGDHPGVGAAVRIENDDSDHFYC